MKRFLSLMLITVLPSIPVNAESYLCITEHSTGFKYNKNTKEWASVKFKTDSKYIVSRAPNNKLYEDYKWVVQKHGTKSIPIWCEKDFSDNGFISCADIIGMTEFEMNNESLRFHTFYSVGYVLTQKQIDESADGGDTPNIEIGKCSRL